VWTGFPSFIRYFLNELSFRTQCSGSRVIYESTESKIPQSRENNHPASKTFFFSARHSVTPPNFAKHVSNKIANFQIPPPPNMADQINMAGLNLGPDGQAPAQRSYIPPHMRNKVVQQPPSPMNGAAAPPPQAINGLNNSAWAG
jgi:hypothetical protein